VLDGGEKNLRLGRKKAGSAKKEEAITKKTSRCWVRVKTGVIAWIEEDGGGKM